MACALTLGYNYNACKGGAGGIKRVLITEVANVTAVTVTANVITAMTLPTGKLFREYDLDKEMGYFKSPLTADVKSDNLVYNHEVGFGIKKFATTIAAEIKLLASNWLYIIVEDRNGKYRAFGIGSTLPHSNGMNLETVSDDSGKAMLDYNGFELVFKSMEDTYAMEVQSSIIAALLIAAP